MTNNELAKLIETRTGEEGDGYRAWLVGLLEAHTAPLIDGLASIEDETDMRSARGTARRAIEFFEKPSAAESTP